MHSVSPLWRSLGGLPGLDQAAAAAPIAAVLVPLYEDRKGTVRVVITRRPDHMPTHAGQLAFPGGRVDPSDPDPIAAALREAEEEVGIRPADVTVLGVLPTITTNRLDMVVLPVVGRLDGVPDLVPEPGEVDLILEPPLEVFLDEDGWRSGLWADHRLWFFEVEGEILWGASAWIMRLLLDVLRSNPPG